MFCFVLVWFSLFFQVFVVFLFVCWFVCLFVCLSVCEVMAEIEHPVKPSFSRKMIFCWVCTLFSDPQFHENRHLCWVHAAKVLLMSAGPILSTSKVGWNGTSYGNRRTAGAAVRGTRPDSWLDGNKMEEF